MVLRKILSNKWMFLCLLLGAVLMIGMVTSVPMYTDGILTRMLTRDLEVFQGEASIYPGSLSYTLTAGSTDPQTRLNNLAFFENELADRQDLGAMPIIGQTRQAQLNWFFAQREGDQAAQGKAVKVLGQTGIFDHIELIGGRLPATEPVDGVYEVLVSEQMMFQNNYLQDMIYGVADMRLPKPGSTALEPAYDYTRRFKIVGVFRPASTIEPYWPDAGAAAMTSLVMDYDLAMRDFVHVQDSFLQDYTWYTAYDYTQIEIEQMDAIVAAIQANLDWFRSFHSGKADMPAQATLTGYSDRATALRAMLSVMQVPILLMLAFYIFMVVQLILDSEKNEISVLKSRGASRSQIMLLYLVESLILVGIALAIGPWLGFFICSVLGASNGFLEFVSRRALDVSLTSQSILYALGSAGLIVLMMLIPAFFASRVSVVEQKLSRTRSKIALWKKTGIDFILLAVAGYGLYSFQNRQEIVAATEATTLTAPVDPLLFLISTAFIIGAGLLFLRFYPMIVRFIYWLGKRIWSPALYASFVHVGRSGGQEQFLMLFLIITLSLGIFSANSARTVNLSAEDKAHYQFGADLVLYPTWASNAAPPAGAPTAEGAASSDDTLGYANSSTNVVTYIEPPFSMYSSLAGVDVATKVLMKQDDVVSISKLGASRKSRTKVMAIEPDLFGQVIDMPENLLLPHINNYLNLLAADPSAALISTDLANSLELQPGDSFQVTWHEQNPITMRVYAIINYWPNPDPKEARDTGEALNLQTSPLLVCNYNLVNTHMTVEPYQVWFRMQEEATSAALYDNMVEKKLRFEYLVDGRQELIAAKNDPMLQGTNGALTMAFIVTMAVSFFGFIIYWTLSIRNRVLQFGILRAMGMSLRSIIVMLFWEQLLISGVAVFMGILVGGLTAQIFTPLLQIVAGAAEQIPPLRVIASRDDYVKIYFIILGMLAVGFGVLGTMISRIRIAQALKLGED